jgi:hypothetical protein
MLDPSWLLYADLERTLEQRIQVSEELANQHQFNIYVPAGLRAHFKTAACGARTDASTPKIGQYLPKTVRTRLATPPLRQGFERHS